MVINMEYIFSLFRTLTLAYKYTSLPVIFFISVWDGSQVGYMEAKHQPLQCNQSVGCESVCMCMCELVHISQGDISPLACYEQQNPIDH